MFVHLHCHSHYSFLRAVPSPQELVAAAAGQKMPAIALTDTGGLYAAVPFYQAAREAGVKPIVGVVLEIEAASPKTKNGNAKESLLLLAANFQGYSNLCRLITRCQLNEKPASLELLNEHHAGLIALYAPTQARPTQAAPSGICRGGAETRPGAASSALTTGTEGIARLKEIFGDALYLEAHHFSASQSGNLRAALALSCALSVPVVATNQVHFLRPEEHLHHRVLNAVRLGSLLTKVAPPDIVNAEAYFKSAEEMQR